MKKILIIGSPGAGKTYLSRDVASITGLPLIHLDKFYHEEDSDYYHNKEAWRTKVKELTSKPRWIIEGNYGSTMYERMKSADTIIFMDYPSLLSVSRVLKRRIQYHNKPRAEMPNTWKEKIAPEFMKFVINFRKSQRPRIVQYLNELENKDIIILKNPKDTRSYIKSLRRNLSS